jgi:hypothetical protein
VSEADDLVIGALANLPTIASDPARAERVRARCHRELAHSARSPLSLFDAAAVAALVCYLAIVLTDVARLAGLF